MLEERVRAQLKEIRDRKRARRGFSTAAVKAFIAEQQVFLDVIKGFSEDTHLLSEDLKLQSKKKTRFASEDRDL